MYENIFVIIFERVRASAFTALGSSTGSRAHVCQKSLRNSGFDERALAIDDAAVDYRIYRAPGAGKY